MVAAAAISCSVYDPALLLRDAGTQTSDADSDANTNRDAEPIDGEPADVAEDTMVDPCMPRQAPARPDVPDSPGGEEYVFAMRTVILDQRDDVWAEVGYDLDGFCTTTTVRDSECTPPPGVDNVPNDDEDGGLSQGIDNTFGKVVLSGLLLLDADYQILADEGLLRGRASMILRVQDWNGEDDDAAVTVSVGHSVRMERADEDPLPQWDGDDTWFVADADYVDGNVDQPRIVSDRAYINNRVVVAPLPNRSAINFPTGEGILPALLTEAFIIGTISEDGSELLDAAVVGRWSLTDLAMAFTATGLCPGTEDRTLIDLRSREAADVVSMRGRDGVCDALSLAVGFTAGRARFGGLDSPPMLPPRCL